MGNLGGSDGFLGSGECVILRPFDILIKDGGLGAGVAFWAITRTE